MKNEEEKLDMLTVQDAARETGLTETAIRSAILRGRLPFVEKYGRKLIPRADFEAYRKQAKPGRPKKQDQDAGPGAKPGAAPEADAETPERNAEK